MLAPWVGGAPGAIHLRSDLERKALAEVGEFDRLPASAYTNAASRRVYSVLQDRARAVLTAGRSVIVDAVFAEQERRQGIEALAAALGVPCRGVWLNAEPEQLLARVAARGKDASDATPAVVVAQVQSDTGSLAPGWPVVDAGGSAFATLDRARRILNISISKNHLELPT
jgi:predicted kinase